MISGGAWRICLQSLYPLEASNSDFPIEEALSIYQEFFEYWDNVFKYTEIVSVAIFCSIEP